jgi:hypothetical protein
MKKLVIINEYVLWSVQLAPEGEKFAFSQEQLDTTYKFLTPTGKFRYNIDYGPPHTFNTLEEILIAFKKHLTPITIHKTLLQALQQYNAKYNF